MTTATAFRLFFRIDKLGKLPHIGNTGISYTTPVFQRKQLLLNSAANGLEGLKNKGSMGSRGFPLSISGSHNYRHFSSVTVADVKKSDDARGAPQKKPKTMESQKIKLISETGAITVVTLEEAQKIAAKKGLHLTPEGLKTESSVAKPTYRLLTNAELINLEKLAATNNEFDSEIVIQDSAKEEKKKVKDVKMLVLKSKIAEHDALSKINNVKKWIEKGHTVRVMIGQISDRGDSETIYKSLEKHLKDTGVRFIQKVVKGDQIRVQLMPPKEPQAQSQGKKAKTTDQEHTKMKESAA